MKYNIKFNGTEEQIQVISKILHSRGGLIFPCGMPSSKTLVVHQGVPHVVTYPEQTLYECLEFQAVDPVGFINAHSDMPGNPWNVNTGVAPDTGEAELAYLLDDELSVHSYTAINTTSCPAEDLCWGLDACSMATIVKWRFAKMEDATKYSVRKEFISGFGILEGKNITYVEDQDKPLTGPIKSDGGSSDYYKLTLKLKGGTTVECETGDVIRALVGNDFDLGNVVKAVRRIYQASIGQGKEGVDVKYDQKKISYFVQEFIDHM